MLKKEQSIALKHNYLDELRLASRQEETAKGKSTAPCSLSFFTNEAVLISLIKAEKSMKLMKVSKKNHSFQQNTKFSQFLKVSSLANNLEKQQKQVAQQQAQIANKTIKFDKGIRPKSALCCSNRISDFKIQKKKQGVIKPPDRQSQLLIQLFPSEDNKKDQTVKNIVDKIYLFHSNPSVFIPRTTKNYGSYLNLSRIYQSKVKSKQKSTNQDKPNFKRNTVSSISQKELHQKCRQILSLACQQKEVAKSIKKKRINFSKGYSNLSKLASTQGSEKAPKNQGAQQKVQNNMRISRKILSQHLDTSNAELSSNLRKIQQLYKIKAPNLKPQIKNQPEYQQRSKIKQSFISTQLTKITQPSLLIESVELGVEGIRKQKQYYRVTYQNNMGKDELNVLAKSNNTSAIHKNSQPNMANNYQGRHSKVQVVHI